ncbi:hypothetical protein IAT38_006250 [Cryptococcus sp. DSM 104549]
MDSLIGVPNNPHHPRNNDGPLGLASDGYLALAWTTVKLLPVKIAGFTNPLVRSAYHRAANRVHPVLRTLHLASPTSSSAVSPPPSLSVFGPVSPFPVGPSSVPWPARVGHRAYLHSPDDLSFQGFWSNGTTFFWRSPAKFRDPGEWQAELALIAQQTAELDALEAYGWDLRNRGTETMQAMELFEALRGSDMDAPDSGSWPTCFAGFVSACLVQVKGAVYFLRRAISATAGMLLLVFGWLTRARRYVLEYNGDGLTRREWMTTQALNESWDVFCKGLLMPETPHSFTLVCQLLGWYLYLGCLVALVLVLSACFQASRRVIARRADWVIPRRFVDSAILEVSQELPFLGAALTNLASVGLLTASKSFLASLPSRIELVVNSSAEPRAVWHLALVALTKTLGSQSERLVTTGMLSEVLLNAKAACQRSWMWLWTSGWMNVVGKGSLIVVSGAANGDHNNTEVLAPRESSDNHAGLDKYSLESAVDRFDEDSEIAMLLTNRGIAQLEFNSDTVSEGQHEAAREHAEEAGFDGAACSATIKPTTDDTNSSKHANGQHQVAVGDDGAAHQELAVEGLSVDLTGPPDVVVGSAATERRLNDGDGPAGIEAVSGELDDSVAGDKGYFASMSSKNDEQKLETSETEPSISCSSVSELDIAPRPVVVDDKGIAPELVAEIALLEKAESRRDVQGAQPTSELKRDAKPASVEAVDPEELVSSVRTVHKYHTKDIETIDQEPQRHKTEPSTAGVSDNELAIERAEVVVDDRDAALELVDCITRVDMAELIDIHHGAPPTNELAMGARPAYVEAITPEELDTTVRIVHGHAYNPIESTKDITLENNLQDAEPATAGESECDLVDEQTHVVDDRGAAPEVTIQDFTGTSIDTKAQPTEALGVKYNTDIDRVQPVLQPSLPSTSPFFPGTASMPPMPDLKDDPSPESLTGIPTNEPTLSTDPRASTVDASTPAIVALSPEEKEARVREAKNLLNQKKKLKKRSKVKELKADAAAAAAAGTPWTNLFVKGAEPSASASSVNSEGTIKLGEDHAGSEGVEAGDGTVSTEAPESNSSGIMFKDSTTSSPPSGTASNTIPVTQSASSSDDPSPSATVDRLAAEREERQRELKLLKKQRAREKVKLLKADAAVFATEQTALQAARAEKDVAVGGDDGVEQPEDTLANVGLPEPATVGSKKLEDGDKKPEVIVSTPTSAEGLLPAGTVSISPAPVFLTPAAYYVTASYLSDVASSGTTQADAPPLAELPFPSPVITLSPVLVELIRAAEEDPSLDLSAQVRGLSDVELDALWKRARERRKQTMIPRDPAWCPTHKYALMLPKHLHHEAVAAKCNELNAASGAVPPKPAPSPASTAGVAVSSNKVEGTSPASSAAATERVPSSPPQATSPLVPTSNGVPPLSSATNAEASSSQAQAPAGPSSASKATGVKVGKKGKGKAKGIVPVLSELSSSATAEASLAPAPTHSDLAPRGSTSSTDLGPGNDTTAAASTGATVQATGTGSMTSTTDDTPCTRYCGCDKHSHTSTDNKKGVSTQGSSRSKSRGSAKATKLASGSNVPPTSTEEAERVNGSASTTSTTGDAPCSPYCGCAKHNHAGTRKEAGMTIRGASGSKGGGSMGVTNPEPGSNVTSTASTGATEGNNGTTGSASSTTGGMPCTRYCGCPKHSHAGNSKKAGIMIRGAASRKRLLEDKENSDAPSSGSVISSSAEVGASITAEPLRERQQPVNEAVSGSTGYEAMGLQEGAVPSKKKRRR